MKIYFLLIYIYISFVAAKSKNLYEQAELQFKNQSLDRASYLFYQFYKQNPNHKESALALYRSALLKKNFDAIFLFEELILKYPKFYLIDKVLDICASFYYLKRDYFKAKYYYKKILNLSFKSNLHHKALFYQVEIALLYEYKNFRSDFLNEIFLKLSKEKYYYNQLRKVLGVTLYNQKYYQYVYQIYNSYNKFPLFKEDIYLLFNATYKLEMLDLAWNYAIILFTEYPRSYENQWIKNFFYQLNKKEKLRKRELKFKKKFNQIYIFFQLASFKNKKNAIKYRSLLSDKLSYYFFILEKRKNKNKFYVLLFGPILKKERFEHYKNRFKNKGFNFVLKKMKFIF